MKLTKYLSSKASLDTGVYGTMTRANRVGATSSFLNVMLFSNTPHWQKLNGMQDLFNWYHSNPVFFATVMIKAREYANMKIKVVHRRSGKVEPENTLKEIPRKIYQLFNRPNVMQNRWEFLMQRKIFEEVAGNSFTYGNFGMGFKPGINTVQALWNVWPAKMQFKLAGHYFEATQSSDVIREWKFEAGKYKKVWTPDEIMHRNKPNTEINDGLIFGRATAQSLYKPLSNIDMGYESRNVIMKNRGMRVILSSNKQDANGPISLLPEEKEVVDKQLKQYGLLEEQSQFFFTEYPLNATPIDQDVMKLGLFEEIATDAMVVANGFGVPEILVKLYLKGATFENQEASVRRLYQGALIPEAEDEMISWNNFLRTEETDWIIVGSFDHVPALQESENQKVEKAKKKVEGVMSVIKALKVGDCSMESAIAMLTTIFDFTPEQAKTLLSPPEEKKVEEEEQQTETETEEEQTTQEDE